jgi:gliding motility-associated-like protein
MNAGASAITLDIDVTPVTCGGVTANGAITVNTTGGLAPFVYAWNTGTVGYDNSLDSLSAGYYEVVVTDSMGCWTSDTIILQPAPCCEVELMNAFTPNNDGLNDGYRGLSSASIELQRFAIFDRWGNKVFDATDANQAWDGNYQGIPCENGSYYVVYEYRCLWDNQMYVRKADVMLIR